jgi:hypothetical protein
MNADGIVKPGAIRPGEYLVAALPLEDMRLLHVEPERLQSVAAIADRITLAAGQRGTIELRLKKLPSRAQ